MREGQSRPYKESYGVCVGAGLVSRERWYTGEKGDCIHISQSANEAIDEVAVIG